MKRKNLLYILIALIIPIGYTLLGSNSNGTFITGNSTAGCSCHAPNNSATSITITSTIPSGGFTGGQTYTITLEVENPNYGGAPNRGGFDLSVNQGTLTAGTGTTLNGTTELVHTSPQVLTAGKATWTFDWTAPASPTSGGVTFSAAGNITNGNSGTGGDAPNIGTQNFPEAAAAAAPTITTTTATSITDVSATITALVTANGAATAVAVEYGTTTAYGSSASMTPTGFSGTTPTSTTANLTGLTPNTTYHYRVVAINSVDTTNSTDDTLKTNMANQIIDFSQEEYSVYPNPASDKFEIKTNEFIKTVEISLYTLTGSQLCIKAPVKEGKSIRVDASDLAKGSYILNATINGKHLSHKLNIK